MPWPALSGAGAPDVRRARRLRSGLQQAPRAALIFAVGMAPLWGAARNDHVQTARALRLTKTLG
jgi:hypothetical protein